MSNLDNDQFFDTDAENREFDKTQLRESGHGMSMGRDYSAHFFRWSFARRVLKKTDNVVEVGCGQDKPLSKVLNGQINHINSYLGVDLNKLKPSNNKRFRFIDEFNFVERYRELLEYQPEGFDALVTFECIEHMKAEHGHTMLQGCYEILKPGGRMFISTPCYDCRRMAKNHIHEWTIDELREGIERVGFTIDRRFGTFMDIKHIDKELPFGGEAVLDAIRVLRPQLAEYYDNDAISCIFAPLYPDHARNNLWVCSKPALPFE